MPTKFITASGKEVDPNTDEFGNNFAANLVFHENTAYQLRKKNNEIYRRQYKANRWIQERYTANVWQYVSSNGQTQALWQPTEDEQVTLLDNTEIQNDASDWLTTVQQTPVLKPAQPLDKDLEDIAQVIGEDRLQHYLDQGLTKPFLLMLCDKEIGVLETPIETAHQYSTDKAQVVAALEHVASTPRLDFRGTKFVDDEDNRYEPKKRDALFGEGIFSPHRAIPAIRAEANSHVTAALNTVAKLTHNSKNQMGQLVTQSPDKVVQPLEQAQKFVKEYVSKKAVAIKNQEKITAEQVAAYKPSMPAPKPIPARTEQLIPTPRPQPGNRADRERNELMQDIIAAIVLTRAALKFAQGHDYDYQHSTFFFRHIADFNVSNLTARVEDLNRELHQAFGITDESYFARATSQEQTALKDMFIGTSISIISRFSFGSPVHRARDEQQQRAAVPTQAPAVTPENDRPADAIPRMRLIRTN